MRSNQPTVAPAKQDAQCPVDCSPDSPTTDIELTANAPAKRTRATARTQKAVQNISKELAECNSLSLARHLRFHMDWTAMRLESCHYRRSERHDLAYFELVPVGRDLESPVVQIYNRTAPQELLIQLAGIVDRALKRGGEGQVSSLLTRIIGPSEEDAPPENTLLNCDWKPDKLTAFVGVYGIGLGIEMGDVLLATLHKEPQPDDLVLYSAHWQAGLWRDRPNIKLARFIKWEWDEMAVCYFERVHFVRPQTIAVVRKIEKGGSRDAS